MRIAALILAGLALSTAACGGDSKPLPQPPPLEIDPRIFEDARARVQAMALQRDNRELGWRCGYQQAWVEVVSDARGDLPHRWRSKTVGDALQFGLILMAIALLGTLALAFILPRFRRRARPASDDDDEGTGWLAFVASSWRRLMRWLPRVLRVDQLDKAVQDARAEAIRRCRATERHLTYTLDRLPRIGGRLQALSPAAAADADAGTPAEAALPDDLPAAGPLPIAADTIVGRDTAALEASPEQAVAPTTTYPAMGSRAQRLRDDVIEWRAEVSSLRRRLSDSSPFRGQLNPTRLTRPLALHERAAQDLRIGLDRAEIAAIPLNEARWSGWQGLVSSPPGLPSAGDAKTLASWIRPVGWAGVGGFVLALPLVGAWASASAVPFFIALLLVLMTLGAVLTARVRLFQAGRLPLLPGLADRLASWLTLFTFLAGALMIASTMATAESGLDLGDAPPVSWPDPRLFKAPEVPPLLPNEVDAFGVDRTRSDTGLPSGASGPTEGTEAEGSDVGDSPSDTPAAPPPGTTAPATE